MHNGIIYLSKPYEYNCVFSVLDNDAWVTHPQRKKTSLVWKCDYVMRMSTNSTQSVVRAHTSAYHSKHCR